MTNKKDTIQKARSLRKQIKGINLPLSIQLVKQRYNRLKFFDILTQAGFNWNVVIQGYCSCDGAPYGYYNIYKGVQYRGQIKFDCCGLII